MVSFHHLGSLFTGKVKSCFQVYSFFGCASFFDRHKTEEGATCVTPSPQLPTEKIFTWVILRLSRRLALWLSTLLSATGAKSVTRKITLQIFSGNINR